jgi:hypothetical protein
MTAPQRFVDNLANLRLVMSVALEYFQANREQFLKSMSGEEVRQAERLISKIRSLVEELEQEFKLLETSLTRQRRLM